MKLDDQQMLVEKRLETLRDDGFDELIDAMTLSIPEDVLQRWEEKYKNPKWIVLAGSDRVCSRCGALLSSGARKQHARWHKYMTFTLWMLETNVLSAISIKLEDVVD